MCTATNLPMQVYSVVYSQLLTDPEKPSVAVDHKEPAQLTLVNAGYMYTVNIQQPTELWKKDKRPKNDRRPPVYHGKNTVAFDCCSIIPFFHNHFLSKILSA